jgi:anti-sigma B factor antagonist
MASKKTTASGKANAKPVRLVIENDLTIYNAPEHKRQLLEALDQSGAVELDLARVGEIDSAGLQVLLLAKRESLARDKALRIVGHSPSVSELLDFFNLASYFGDPLVMPATGSS